jgi:hypothetical protein
VHFTLADLVGVPVGTPFNIFASYGGTEIQLPSNGLSTYNTYYSLPVSNLTALWPPTDGTTREITITVTWSGGTFATGSVWVTRVNAGDATIWTSAPASAPLAEVPLAAVAADIHEPAVAARKETR